MAKMETIIIDENNFLNNKLKFECLLCATSICLSLYIHSASSHNILVRCRYYHLHFYRLKTEIQYLAQNETAWFVADILIIKCFSSNSIYEIEIFFN